MFANRETLIGNKGSDHVRLFDIGRPNIEDWFEASVEVHCDGWRGKFRASFQKGEFRSFAEELTKLSRKLVVVAQLRPMEENIILDVTGDRKGHLAVKGEAFNTRGWETKLSFGFEIDQTYLQEIVASLLKVDPR